MAPTSISIQADYNAYADSVQGLVNQPPTVVRLLQRACERLELKREVPTQGEVYDRLLQNAPRVAIVGGSSDHLAHITDDLTIAASAVAVWQHGGVPFSFGIPVMCDGTAQAHLGMSYSLFTRNLSAEFVASQMESHAYHAAIVLQGCDKTPFGIACGLAAVDRARMRRGEPPLWAAFVPGHVLKGGSIPPETQSALEALVRRASRAKYQELADDLLDTMNYVVQCTTNEAYAGVFQRMADANLLSNAEHARLRRDLATCACHADGGICAFNGTGNSSRIVLAAMGLVHPAVELLSKPPSPAQMDLVVRDLFKVLNRPQASVANLVRDNWENAVRVHSATGGSSNLVLHLLAVANYAEMRTTIDTYERMREAVRVPDLFDFSLTSNRTHYELALQTESGQIRGLDTIYHELTRQKVPLALGAETVAGATWEERLRKTKGLAAQGVGENQVILAAPRRPNSGVDVLRGNFFDSAVLKISGMTDVQLEQFDGKAHFVVYMNNEEEATAALLDLELVTKLPRMCRLTKQALLAALDTNAPNHPDTAALARLSKDRLYNELATQGILKIAMVIAGQGPDAYGMPEMFAPMQHINSNRGLRKITTLISDGRYSGVSYGAAIGHVTPEAANDGGILYIKSGDVMLLSLTNRTLDLLDPEAFAAGRIRKLNRLRTPERNALAVQRLKALVQRGKSIAGLCRQEVTGADTGVIPSRVWKNVNA